ncbi:MAG: aspartate aminotransferase family protein [Pirellulales bacterium]|nr:aspartate aminotransferase family protein [Pirellulales bacterium]
MSTVIEPRRQVFAIEHPNEPQSNEIRRTIAELEPLGMRTFTPSMTVIARSEGCYHYTPEGKKLADFTSGVLVTNLGHNPARWWKSMQQYMGHGLSDVREGYSSAMPLSSYNAITTLEAMACERLIANMQSQPGGGRMEQVLWSASGSEGMIKALRAALAQDLNRQVILATRHGFHGKKGLAGAVTGTEADPERDPRVRFISFPHEECYSVQNRRQPIDLTKYEMELTKLRDELGDAICCLVTEPYLGGGGSYHPQKEYLQLLESFCRRHDIVFILDEVQANFGRTGSMYAFTEYGVEPDIVVLGKGMANGVPVDAAVGRADLFARFDYGEASDTWSGHPLGCAAVLSTLDEFEKQDVLGQARELTRVIEEGLLKLTELPAVDAIRGEGTVWGIQCAAIGARNSKDVAKGIVKACYHGDNAGHSIHLLGPLSGDVIRVAPPLVMPLDESEEYFAALYRIVANLA